MPQSTWAGRAHNPEVASSLFVGSYRRGSSVCGVWWLPGSASAGAVSLWSQSGVAVMEGVGSGRVARACRDRPGSLDRPTPTPEPEPGGLGDSAAFTACDGAAARVILLKIVDLSFSWGRVSSAWGGGGRVSIKVLIESTGTVVGQAHMPSAAVLVDASYQGIGWIARCRSGKSLHVVAFSPGWVSSISRC